VAAAVPAGIAAPARIAAPAARPEPAPGGAAGRALSRRGNRTGIERAVAAIDLIGPLAPVRQGFDEQLPRIHHFVGGAGLVGGLHDPDPFEAFTVGDHVSDGALRRRIGHIEYVFEVETLAVVGKHVLTLEVDGIQVCARHDAKLDALVINPRHLAEGGDLTLALGRHELDDPVAERGVGLHIRGCDVPLPEGRGAERCSQY